MTACQRPPVAVPSDSPTISPAVLMALAILVTPPGSVPRSFMLDPFQKKSMRSERRTVAEHGFADNVAAVVDVEARAENGFRQAAEALDLVAGPTGGVDNAGAEEGIARNRARRIDLKGRAGRTPRERTEIRNSALRRPLDRHKVRRRLAFDVGITYDRAGIVNALRSVDGSSLKRAQILHAARLTPHKGMLPRNQPGTGIAKRRRGVGTSDHVAKVVDPESARFVVAFEHAEIGHRISLRRGADWP